MHRDVSALLYVDVHRRKTLLAQQHSCWGTMQTAVLLDAAVRLRHAHPPVVYDACLFLEHSLEAGLPVLNLLTDSCVLTTLGEAMQTAALACAQSAPQTRMHVLDATIRCLCTFATRCAAFCTSSDDPDHCALAAASCILLFERCTQSVCVLPFAAHMASLMLALLSVLSAATTKAQQSQVHIHPLTPVAATKGEEQEQLLQGMHRCAAQLVTGLTTLINTPATDPQTGTVQRHLLPMLAPATPPSSEGRVSDAAGWGPGGASPQTPSQGSALPNSGATAAADHDAGGDSIAGWRHPQLASLLLVAHQLVHFLEEGDRRASAAECSGAMAAVRSLWQYFVVHSVKAHGTHDSLASAFPGLYQALCEDVDGPAVPQGVGVDWGGPASGGSASGGLACPAAGAAMTDGAWRHATHLFQVLSTAAHPMECFATLDGLNAIEILHPLALSHAVADPGKAFQAFERYLCTAPNNGQDHVIAARVLTLCVGLLDRGVVHVCDLEHLTSMLLVHTLPGTLAQLCGGGPVGPDTRTALLLPGVPQQCTVRLLLQQLGLVRALLTAGLQQDATPALSALAGGAQLLHPLCMLLMHTLTDALGETILPSPPQPAAAPPEFVLVPSQGLAGVLCRIVTAVAVLPHAVLGLHRERLEGTLRAVLLALVDAVDRYARSQTHAMQGCGVGLSPSPVPRRYPTGLAPDPALDSVPAPLPGTGQAHMRKALAQACVAALLALAGRMRRWGSAWAEMVDLRALKWMVHNADVAFRAAHYALTANALQSVSPPPLALAPTALPDAVVVLSDAQAPPVLRTAALQLLLRAAEVAVGPTCGVLCAADLTGAGRASASLDLAAPGVIPESESPVDPRAPGVVGVSLHSPAWGPTDEIAAFQNAGPGVEGDAPNVSALVVADEPQDPVADPSLPCVSPSSQRASEGTAPAEVLEADLVLSPREAHRLQQCLWAYLASVEDPVAGALSLPLVLKVLQTLVIRSGGSPASDNVAVLMRVMQGLLPRTCVRATAARRAPSALLSGPRPPPLADCSRGDPAQVLHSLVALERCWKLCWLLLRSLGNALLAERTRDVRLLEALLDTLLQVLCDRHEPLCPCALPNPTLDARASAARNRLTTLLLAMLEHLLHVAPDAGVDATGLLAPPGPEPPAGPGLAIRCIVALGLAIDDAELPLNGRAQAAAVLAHALHSQSWVRAAAQSRFAAANFVGLPPHAQAWALLCGLADASQAPPQAEVGALLMEALQNLWADHESCLRCSAHLHRAVHGALCAVLRYSQAAKDMAVTCGWVRHLLEDLNLIADRLRFALLHAGKKTLDQVIPLIGRGG